MKLILGKVRVTTYRTRGTGKGLSEKQEEKWYNGRRIKRSRVQVFVYEL